MSGQRRVADDDDDVVVVPATQRKKEKKRTWRQSSAAERCFLRDGQWQRDCTLATQTGMTQRDQHHLPLLFSARLQNSPCDAGGDDRRCQDWSQTWNSATRHRARCRCDYYDWRPDCDECRSAETGAGCGAGSQRQGCGRCWEAEWPCQRGVQVEMPFLKSLCRKEEIERERETDLRISSQV